ncbi:hypothetical protein D3C73_1350590 [compost metagenome]
MITKISLSTNVRSLFYSGSGENPVDTDNMHATKAYRISVSLTNALWTYVLNNTSPQSSVGSKTFANNSSRLGDRECNFQQMSMIREEDKIPLCHRVESLVYYYRGALTICPGAREPQLDIMAIGPYV